MLSTAAFAEFGKHVVLFCHNTSYVDGDPDQNLLEERGGEGWPYLCYLDRDGELLAKYQGPRTVEGFRHSLGAVEVYAANVDTAFEGDPVAQVALLTAQLELRMLVHEEAARSYARLRKLERYGELVPPEKARWFEQQMVNLEFAAVLAEVSSIEDRQQRIQVAGEKMLAMKKQGRIPTERARNFWSILLSYGEQREDHALILEVAETWKKSLDPDDTRQQRTIQRLDEAIRKARSARGCDV